MTNRIRTAMAKRDQGFTLIELLVVIIIIGILAAIAIPVFLNQRKKGVDAGMKSDLKNAATHVETWVTDNPQKAIVSSTAAATNTGGAAPDTGTAGVADVATDTPLAGFKASPGNKVNLTAGSASGTYVLSVENDNSSEGAGECLRYDSAAGGLTGTWAAC